MPSLKVSEIQASVRPAATYVASLLHAIAREEQAGRRPARLTEKGLATWSRFKGRLTSIDLAVLLFEDAAVVHPTPFQTGPPAVDEVSRLIIDDWLKEISKLGLESESTTYIAEQAQLLGLTKRLAKSELHVVKAHQKVFELPGTG